MSDTPIFILRCSTVAWDYRKLLVGYCLEKFGGDTPEGRQRYMAGFSAERIEGIWRQGDRLPLAAALRCRVRYFTDGAVLGTKAAVDTFFDRKRQQFGEIRTLHNLQTSNAAHETR